MTMSRTCRVGTCQHPLHPRTAGQVQNVIPRGGCRPEAEEVEDESIANVMDRVQLSVAMHVTHWRYSTFPDISGGLDYLAILILTPP